MTSNEPTKQAPEIAQLVRLTTALNEHNETFSAGPSLGRGLFSFILASLPFGEEPPMPQKPPPNADHNAQTIFESHSKFLASIGFELTQNRERSLSREISLTSEQGEKKDEVTNGVVIPTDKIEVSLIDAERFVAFVGRFNPSDVSSHSSQQAFAFLGRTLDHEFKYECVRANRGLSEKNLDELATTVLNTASEFNRLGLKEQAATLAFHAEHFVQGDLWEYLLAEKSGLMNRVGFGPHLWHVDSSPESFMSRWMTAVDALERIEENPKAATLADDCRKYLTSSAAAARQHFEAIPDHEPELARKYYDNIKEEMLSVVSIVEERLTAR